MSPYNVNNGTKGNLGKWNIAFTIPETGSTTLKNSKLFDYSEKKSIKENTYKSEFRPEDYISFGSFKLTDLSDVEFIYKENTTLKIVNNQLIYNNGNSSIVTSLDNVLHLKDYSKYSYFRNDSHLEVAEILNHWIGAHLSKDTTLVETIKNTDIDFDMLSRRCSNIEEFFDVIDW